MQKLSTFTCVLCPVYMPLMWRFHFQSMRLPTVEDDNVLVYGIVWTAIVIIKTS